VARLALIRPTRVKGFPPHDLVEYILAAATRGTCTEAARDVCRLWYELAKKRIWEEPHSVAALFDVLARLNTDKLAMVRPRSAISYTESSHDCHTDF
jgi:hypothetical protein